MLCRVQSPSQPPPLHGGLLLSEEMEVSQGAQVRGATQAKGQEAGVGAAGQHALLGITRAVHLVINRCGLGQL